MLPHFLFSLSDADENDYYYYYYYRAPSVFSVKKAMQTYARQGILYFFLFFQVGSPRRNPVLFF